MLPGPAVWATTYPPVVPSQQHAFTALLLVPEDQISVVLVACVSSARNSLSRVPPDSAQIMPPSPSTQPQVWNLPDWVAVSEVLDSLPVERS